MDLCKEILTLLYHCQLQMYLPVTIRLLLTVCLEFNFVSFGFCNDRNSF